MTFSFFAAALESDRIKWVIHMACPMFVLLYLSFCQVKLPDDVMLEADTTLSTLAPIIKSGGVVPER